MVVNTLHALAINAGLSLRAKLLTQGGRRQLSGLQLSAISQQQRDELVSLADELTKRIHTVEQWLQAQAKSDPRVMRLQTHPGVGLLTSLCLLHTLGDLSRFSSTRKVAAYVGFDPMEDSSAERKAYGGISKAGSRLLRYLLVEAGQTAAKDDEHLKQFYRRCCHDAVKPAPKWRSPVSCSSDVSSWAGLKLTMPSFSVAARKRRSETAVGCQLARRRP